MATSSTFLYHIGATLYTLALVQAVFFTKVDDNDDVLEYPRIGKRVKDITSVYSRHMLEKDEGQFQENINQHVIPAYRLMDIFSRQPYISSDKRNVYDVSSLDQVRSADLTRPQLLQLIASNINK